MENGVNRQDYLGAKVFEIHVQKGFSKCPWRIGGMKTSIRGFQKVFTKINV